MVKEFDHGLFGLDRNQGLIDDDMIALGYVPSDDLGFFQPFAEIRKVERDHVKAIARRTAASMRARPACRRLERGYGITVS